MRVLAMTMIQLLGLRLRNPVVLAVTALVIGVLGFATPSRAQASDTCAGDLNVGRDIPPKDLRVEQTCFVRGGTYTFRHVNIGQGGKLIFVEPPREAGGELPLKGQDFWATSIIIENGGGIYAGVEVPDVKETVGAAAYGTNGKTLTFHLYGADPRGNDPAKNEGPGVSCLPIKDATKFADCGIPLKKMAGNREEDFWTSNGKTEFDLPGGVRDYFYQYGSLHGDAGTDKDTGEVGHFGYKVWALSYGGTLRLRGLKGTSLTLSPDPKKPEGDPAKIGDIAVMLKAPATLTSAEEKVVTNSGADWARLTKFGKTQLSLDRSVANDWQEGDEVVVTTTDYLPDHSEVRRLGAKTNAADVVNVTPALTYDHADKPYDIATKVGKEETAFRTALAKADNVKEGDEVPFLDKAETRAAVALLTRSIRIVSEGDKPGDTFKDATEGRPEDTKTKRPAVVGNPHYQYGGHVVFRQGFQQLQIQGVEFKQLGQGGLLGRYPVHFHVARKVPADTYVIDSSVNESMTRWVVLHSTLGATLARNVGYKSIGHGFFLEDATETDNKFYSNIGINARAAVDSGDNPRKIPGLLESPNYSAANRPLKYNSDSTYPTAFWITNGWNAFAGNMAAGAGTCGACYWYISAGNHDMVETDMSKPMKWSGYSLIQKDPRGSGYAGRAGRSPIMLFYKNYCSTAMHGLSITDGSPCPAVMDGRIAPIPNKRNVNLRSTNDENTESPASRMYYPRYGGNRNPAVCNQGEDCTKVDCLFGAPDHCAASVFSYLTSQFNYAETNFGAIWLRSGYLLLDHNFLSDIQGPGVTFVTGGDYQRSNLPIGYWGIVSNSIFVGGTQKDPFTIDPTKDKDAKLPCKYDGNVCLNKEAGVAYPLSNFGTGERMYNVYDGPAYEDANAYLDIHPERCKSLAECIYFQTPGVRKALTAFPGVAVGEGYLPNAAIGWKQSNGFYYPPAFRSQNLFFKNVDIRHYVVEPLTYPGTYRTKLDEVQRQYILPPGNTTFFLNWSDVDRQTELSDDDGSLTGFNRTVSVNEDPFFRAPSQTAQCRSGVGVDASNACASQKPPNPVTARTSPYDHITTALYRAEGGGGPDSNWGNDCTNQNCTGVPIYREYLTGNKGDDAASSTREWVAWVQNACDKQNDNLVGKVRTVWPFDRYGIPGKGILQPDATRTLFQTFDTQCPSPFVRMAGMAFGQRSVLTVNNGRYFIDTTQSANFQRKTPDLQPVPPEQRWISLFEKGKSYYVYFLFAKKETKQIYQIYGGSGFKPSMISGVRVNINSWTGPGSFTNWAGFPWKAYQDPDMPGVVNVEVDFSQIDQAKDGSVDPTDLTDDDTCQPRTYCKKISGINNSKATCGCDETKLGVLALLNPAYKNVCKNVCEHWAVQDLDCPSKGCFGFKFTMADDFTADDTFHRPKPMEFPTKAKDPKLKEPTPWEKIFLTRTPTLPDKAPNPGGCYYADGQIPNDKSASCKVAD